MSEFSEAFSRLIKEKNIPVYSLVKYCNSDRSTMYKIINGKRKPPSETVFNKICDYMHLAPLEYEQFKNAYRITLIGKDNYYRRQNVEDFILSFPSETCSFHDTISQDIRLSCLDSYNTEKSIFLSGQVEFNRVLHQILIKESNKEHGKIGLLLQPDYEFLFGILANLRTANASDNSVFIEHIICLNKTMHMDTDNKYYNLVYLKNILPLYISDINYHPYYFYDDITSHYYNHNALSCMILTTEYALLCTSDYCTGILHHDRQTVEALWKLYHSYQSKCAPLFHMVDSVLEECAEINSIGWGRTPSYAIQPEPCLIPFITPQMIENVIYPNIPGRSLLVSQLQNFISESRQRINSRNSHIYHTKNGLISFAKTGRMSEIPNEIYSPFTKKQRILLFQQLLTAFRTSGFWLLKGPLEFLPNNFHLYVTETSGYLLFSNCRKRNIYLIFQEPSMVFAFSDYASCIDINNHLASEEESSRFIAELINELA